MQNHFLLLYFHRSASVPEETGEERQQVARSRESMLSLVIVSACCVGKIPVCQEPAKASRGQSIANGCETLEANKNMKGQKPCIFFVHSGRFFSNAFEYFLFQNNFQCILENCCELQGMQNIPGFCLKFANLVLSASCGVINTVEEFQLMNFKMLG